MEWIGKLDFRTVTIRVPTRFERSHKCSALLKWIFLDFDSFQPQPPDTPMSTVSDATKQEIQSAHGMPHSLSSQSSTGHSRSKPQACKVCGKMLSSASSYYVHMKLHSGTKPFQCTVSETFWIFSFFKLLCNAVCVCERDYGFIFVKFIEFHVVLLGV